MSRAVTAAVLSALVFPGAGQHYLGYRLRAWLFIGPTLGAAYAFFGQVYARAQLIADEIASGRTALNVGSILARIHQQGQDASMTAQIAGAIMVACWALSTLDAWYLGRHAAPAPTPKEKA